MTSLTVEPAIKREAARTLLERMTIKNKLSRFFLWNAATKHGVPLDDDREFDLGPIRTEEPVEPIPLPQPAPQPSVTQSVVNQPPVANGMSGAMKGALLALAGVSGLAGAGTAGYLMANRDEQPAVQPADPGVWRYSPYQFLEDQGDHLP